MYNNTPMYFHDLLIHNGRIDDIYKSMGSPDLADPVLTFLDVLRNSKNLAPVVKEFKSETKSTAFRNEGNQAYASQKYQKALICYNQALLYAPNNSRAMKLAYSNRSALLLQVKAYSASLNDIETCFSMGCPQDIIAKLRKRKEEVKSIIWIEDLNNSARASICPREYFKFYGKCNPQIPCASTDVGVVMEDHMPKVVATNNIKVGTVLAVETAFVSQHDPKNQMFSCYYCHKINLNLKPCDGCCLALFCDEDCRETCLTLYHNIECKIIEMLEEISPTTVSRLAIKALLKMKYMCQSWSELHSATNIMGINRQKSSSTNEIFNSNNKFSLLNVKDERHFLNGPLYNVSFTSAMIIHYLESIPGFFPQIEGARHEAVRTVARLLMFLSLYSSHTQIKLCVYITEQENIELQKIDNYGWFSFIGKLKNSCNPNLLAVGLNKKIGLVTIAPIKKGTELTISYVGHWLDSEYDDKVKRNRNMFILYGNICNCPVCTGTYKSNNMKLSDIQKKKYRKLNIAEMSEGKFCPNKISDLFPKLCKTLALLSDVPYSYEYKQVYLLFRRCVMYLQDVATDNMKVDYD